MYPLSFASPAEDARLVLLMLNNTECFLALILIIFPVGIVFVRQRFLSLMPMTDVPNIAAPLVLLNLVLRLLIKADALKVAAVAVPVRSVLTDLALTHVWQTLAPDMLYLLVRLGLIAHLVLSQIRIAQPVTLSIKLQVVKTAIPLDFPLVAMAQYLLVLNK